MKVIQAIEGEVIEMICTDASGAAIATVRVRLQSIVGMRSAKLAIDAPVSEKIRPPGVGASGRVGGGRTSQDGELAKRANHGHDISAGGAADARAAQQEPPAGGWDSKRQSGGGAV